MTTTLSQISDLAGRVIIAGFEERQPPRYLVDALARDALGGVVLFKRNIESAAQVAELNREIRSLGSVHSAPVISVDQEGGRVQRIEAPLITLPPARVFGDLDRPDLTERAGRLVGAELSALGFTVDFAPVLDVDTNPVSSVIGDRSYGGDVETVISHGLAFGRGLREGGVLPVAKHFPGHGDAALDSHVALPTVTHPRERLEAVEFAPFSAWARTGIGGVMTAHIVFEAIDGERPATLSPLVLRNELRQRLRFGGVVFSDDLEMGAVADGLGTAAAAVAAIRAGVDGLLVCRREEVFAEVHATLCRAAEADPAFAGRLERAAGHLRGLARPTATPAASWIGSTEHRRQVDALLASIDTARSTS